MHRLLAPGFAAIMLGILLVQTIAPAVATQEHELAYDNGIPGGSVKLPYTPTMWSGGEPEKEETNVWVGNHMLAVKFTSDNNTVEMLREARFYVTGDLHSFNVWAFDSDQEFFIYYRHFGPSYGSQWVSDVYSWTVTPTSPGWVNLNVTSWNSIFVRGDFYIAVEFTVAQKPSLGVDTTGPKLNRSLLVANQTVQGWIPYSTYAKQHGLPDGNLMIRALVSPVYETGNGIASTASSEKAASGWEVATFIGVIVLGAVAAVAFRALLERPREFRRPHK